MKLSHKGIRRKLVGCAVGSVAWSCSIALSAAAPVCFQATDKSPFPVIQNAPPPRTDGQPDYRYYPVDIAATAQVAPLTATRSRTVEGAFWMWANHGPRARDHGEKGNITPGSPGVQIRFSSIEAADACTMARTAVLIGAQSSRYLEEGRLTATEGSQQADTLNVCVLPEQPLPAGDPIVLDYEVQDGRTADQTLTFLTAWSKLVHSAGHAAILYTNPLDAPSQRFTQITPATAPEIAELFDRVSVFLWSGNRQGNLAESFEAQARMYQTKSSKLMIVFELANTTVQDAKTVNQLLRAGQAGSLNFWRNHAVQGGDCGSDTNIKIACTAFGRCP